MASQLITSVDTRTCASVRVSLPTLGRVQKPALMVVDTATGRPLQSFPLADTLSTWNWRFATSYNQVVTILARGVDVAEERQVLLDCRIRKTIANALKEVGTGGCTDHEELDQLRFYHALAVLLFTQGNYVDCQEYLTLVEDLGPCDCGC